MPGATTDANLFLIGQTPNLGKTSSVKMMFEQRDISSQYGFVKQPMIAGVTSKHPAKRLEQRTKSDQNLLNTNHEVQSGNMLPHAQKTTKS